MTVGAGDTRLLMYFDCLCELRMEVMGLFKIGMAGGAIDRSRIFPVRDVLGIVSFVTAYTVKIGMNRLAENTRTYVERNMLPPPFRVHRFIAMAVEAIRFRLGITGHRPQDYNCSVEQKKDQQYSSLHVVGLIMPCRP